MTFASSSPVVFLSEAEDEQKKVNLGGHCALCLGKVSVSRRGVVRKMDHIWPYLCQDWNTRIKFVFIIGKLKGRDGKCLESRVPEMCTLCRDSVKTLDILHQELVQIKKKIETQVNGIQRMMESNNFEKECVHLVSVMNQERIPPKCVENTNEFLVQLHRRNFKVLENFIQEKPAFGNIAEEFSSIATSHFLHKDTQNIPGRLSLSQHNDNFQNTADDLNETKPDLGITTLGDDVEYPDSNSFGGKTSPPSPMNQVIKIEPEDDFSSACTSPDADMNNSQLSSINNSNDVEGENTSRTNYCDELGAPGLSLEKSEQSDSIRNESYESPVITSRGFRTRNANQNRRRKLDAHSDDSDYSLPDEVDSHSSSEDSILDDDYPDPKTTIRKVTPRRSLLIKETIHKVKQRQVVRESSLKSGKIHADNGKRKKLNENADDKLALSDDDSNQSVMTMTKSGQECEDDTHVSSTDCDEEYPSSSRSKKRKTVTKTRSKSKLTTEKKMGRPRKHPKKEKVRSRNTLCEICCEKLPDKFQLFQHLQTHVKDYACTCETCGTAYVSRKRMLAKHFRKAFRCRTAAGYPNPPAFLPKICDTCGFQTDSFVTLKAHLQEHEIPADDAKNHVCPMPDCKESFTLRQMVEFHIDKHLFQGTSSAASQKCPVCSEALEYAKTDMKDHLQASHNIVDILPCKYCPHVFHNIDFLVEHLVSHLSEGVCCHICQDQIKYYKADHLREHFYNIHQVGSQYFCESCDYRTFCKSNLRNHQALKHEGKYRKTFTCPICTLPPVVCRSKDMLVTHNIKVHGATPYKCKVCGDTFDNKTCWSRHEKSHFGIAPRRQSCPHCEKSFNILSRLQYHIERVHTPKRMEKSWKCDQCDKSYYDSHGLRRHKQAIHLGIKYLCQECGRSFNEPGPLKNHMRRHTGERPFKCQFCSNDFRYKDAHRRHEESHIRLGDKFQPGRTFDRKRKPL